MERFVCVHGHFYQPPRESPWLGAVTAQESAAPYHDWNRRITAECYAANARAHLGGPGDVGGRVVNNYRRISFNFGPTLLSWLECADPTTYRAILDADRASRGQRSGHGSALAQVYGHPILPLCNDRDQRTQVLWGIRDFEHRFRRQPAGMWLPETAVDAASLEALARSGIRFTVLAPSQAFRLRHGETGPWHDVSDGSIDPRRAYRLDLPSGRSIAIFFYDAELSAEVAFGGLAVDGERLASRLLGRFAEVRDEAQLVHIATDGESWGHHRRHAEQALALALERIESSGRARLTNYAEFLERFPPTRQVQIREASSWSCPHGLGRWKDDCGCASGATTGRQAWRAPLRHALDWLRDTLAPLFEARAAEYLRDPWEARDASVGLLLDRSRRSRAAFFDEHGRGALDRRQRAFTLDLLELQRYALLMYTSCAWFFEDLSRIETLQILQYAARSVELGERLFGKPLEEPFLELLERAPSNLPDYGNGRRLYELRVRPARDEARRR